MRRVLLATAALMTLAGVARAAVDPAQVLAAYRQAASSTQQAAAGELKLAYGFAGQGMTGEVSSSYDVASGDFVDSFDLGVINGANGFDGRRAWMRDMSGAVTPQGGGDTRQLAVNEAYRNANGWWRPDFGGAAVRSLGARTDGGETFDVLAVTPRGGKTFEAWFDERTHMLARIVEPQGFETVTSFLSNYAPHDGFMVPAKVVVDDGTGLQYRQTETLKSATLSPPVASHAYSAPSWSRASASIDNAAGRTTVPFKLLNNHIYAEVTINGKGPFLCIFDTGGHDIITPETAKALTVTSQGQAAGAGAGEGVVNIGFVKNVTFQVGDLVIHDRGITVIPFEQGGVEGFDEQGMVGFEVFRRFVTVIDYGKHTLTFIDPSRFDPRDAGTPVHFEFYSHLPEVEGTFEGLPGGFDIDTGSRSELDLTKPFVDAQNLIAKNPDGVEAVDGWGVGGPSRSYVTHASYMTLGPVRINNLVVGFGTQSKGALADPNYIGNVGTALLKRFVVTFDYDHQIMYLKPRPGPLRDVDAFDRSGMWVNLTPAGFKVVYLASKGAAETAGLKTGDLITAVNGTTFASISLSDLRRSLRDEAPGTRVALTVSRADAPRKVDLVLKNQF